MTTLTLIIGNKNYSSWSLRPWLVLRHLGVEFCETRVPLYRAESTPILTGLSPSGLVPVLHDGELRVWDSLAICEYLAERFPDAGLWPDDVAARAVARAVSAEMHSGFGGLRSAMSMNIRGHYPDKGRTPECLKDIARINALWSDCRKRYGAGGAFLFGRFGIADAMYAPVALRFRTYAVESQGTARAYADTLLTMPALGEWIEAATTESERIPMFDMYD